MKKLQQQEIPIGLGAVRTVFYQNFRYKTLTFCGNKIAFFNYNPSTSFGCEIGIILKAQGVIKEMNCGELKGLNMKQMRL
jgi:hypothetical protein